MNLEWLLVKALIIIYVTAAKLNLIHNKKSLEALNDTVNPFDYNDLITLDETEGDYEEANEIEEPSLSSPIVKTRKRFKYSISNQNSLKDNDDEKREQRNQQHPFTHYPTIKFNNENLNSNKLKKFTKDVATETIPTVVTTTTTTFNDNKHVKDLENDDDDDDDGEMHDVVNVDNIEENDDNLQEKHQTELNTPNSFRNAFVGQMPQFQQQLYQQQKQQQLQQPSLSQEYHHLSDYLLLFNPERHTEFYLHTISTSPNYGNAREEAILDNEEAAYGNVDDDDDKDNNDDADTMMMTNLTNPRVFHVVTDTIGAAFGVNTRPVAAINGIRIEEIQLYNGLSLRQSRFNPFNPCRIIIHGWLGGSKAGIYNTLVPEYLKLGKGSYNVITVDWGKGAIADYITASYRVKPVGKVVAKFIDFLHQESGIPFENIQVIGFSMGAHVAGIAGKHIQTGRLPAIYALDPALPLFRYEHINERIDLNDADYVEVVHTSAGSYGYDHPLGHVDFYINFGYNQPGCYLIECSHFRAFQIFAQSLRNELLPGTECSAELWLDMIKRRRCIKETGLKLSMTAEGLNASMMALRRGVYYIITNS